MVFRFNRFRTVLIVALIINLIILFYLASIQDSENNSTNSKNNALFAGGTSFMKGGKLATAEDGDRLVEEAPNGGVTIVIREFEEFENQIVDTVSQLQQHLKNVPIVVIGDKFPYPPLPIKEISSKFYHFISLAGDDIRYNITTSRPELYLRTKFVMIIPDGTVIDYNSVLVDLSGRLIKNSTIKVVAVPTQGADLNCIPVWVDLKRWTVEYNVKSPMCNNLAGPHSILMRTRDFLSLSNPYLKPFPESLYLQAAHHNWSIEKANTVSLSTIPKPEMNPHNRWKLKHNYEVRQKQMYRKIGIKLVIRESGRRQWFGCHKETTRCFDTVVDDMPEYLYQSRWTPPCCLRALRDTARYVFEILDSCNARYWLEGGSLLGAARQGDIIPWDYDVDIGIYENDVNKCDFLRQCSKGPYVDGSGFVWERAKEGDFYRVQYSETNRLHVDIFPFYSKNGTMTKRTWIKTHRQDTEFPEHYLKPLTKISFAGLQASAPNNIKLFLEFKFGVGVIEHPKYPNAEDPI